LVGAGFHPFIQDLITFGVHYLEWACGHALPIYEGMGHARCSVVVTTVDLATRVGHSHVCYSHGLDWALDLDSAKERVELLCILPYSIGSRAKCACGQMVNEWKAGQSNGQEPFCDAVKQSSSKNNGH